MRVIAPGSPAVPGVSSAILGVVGCPACWPAYVALLGSLGLGVLAEAAVFVPLTLVLVAVALGALAFRAHHRRGLRPFGLGVLGAAVVLYGRFAVAADSVVLAGAGLLMAASIWNGWPRKTVACAPCETADR